MPTHYETLNNRPPMAADITPSVIFPKPRLFELNRINSFFCPRDRIGHFRIIRQARDTERSSEPEVNDVMCFLYVSLPFLKPFIKLIPECLFVTRTQGRWASCLYAATPHRFHEISDIEPRFDILFSKQFPSRTES